MTQGAAAAADGSGYFLYHSIGLFPDKGRVIGAALAAFAEAWGRPDDAQWSAALGARQEFIERWRDLVNAEAGTLTSAENVTSALFMLLDSLPAGRLRGRRVLVAADCFPSVHFLLAGLAARHGYRLDTVPVRPGETWVREEDLLARWGADVGAALLTTVTSNASHRCDLEGLIAHGRQMGSLIGVDITQSAGLFPFDVAASGVDFAVSTSLKWLCGTPGAGILYVQRSLLPACRPALRGWFSQPDIFAWDLDGFDYAADARRFDNGTPAVLACVGTLPALAWHARQDRAAALAHNRSLSAMLIAAAAELGLPLASPREEARRGGGVMLQLPVGAAPAVLARLRAASVYADCRGTTLRLSPGPMTTAEGVQRLVQALAAAVRER